MATEETNSSQYLTLQLKEKYVDPQEKENAGE
jgi:hypothetical protein